MPKYWTQTMNSELSVSKTEQCTGMSISCLSGSVEIQGELSRFGLNSNPITVSEGQAILLQGGNSQDYIDGVTITPAGSMSIIAMF